nr:hypothetical protein [Candidatus Sigynarchaeota archaeon]
MNDADKKGTASSSDDTNGKYALNAKLEILTRIRQNLLDKVAEIDGKISDIKQNKREVGTFENNSF